ncbi:stemmadenine O-acetyltransferase [Ziziphus jujuba]|uniref:Stemmadenine O-acetyltransferase n=2 Tax=Ziziphus jujuba TaxID=326968 RepID=A0ABM3IPN1_ZIZJJ|nr:stemmadenine O-acetyltransferase [Ziziphus jujuba]KAH7521765.1 hypothetical protein FEM48_Zijuj07G0067100 [Ziziphus jujuba var. spinosa]
MATTALKVEIIHRETLKPSSPTPYNLKNFKLCLIDQLAPTMYVPLILFYPHVNNGVDEAEKKTQLLKKTLSETLTLFYPLAGRIKTHDSIVCNDEGVEFFKAQANFPLSKILEKPNTYFLRKFLAAEPESIQARTGALLLVQVTFFQCGGMAIGISSSHKIGDASTLSAFLKSWTSMAVFGSEHGLVPEFNAAELLPPSDDFQPLEKIPGKCRTSRFVFYPKKIASLKENSSSESVKNPSRIEAVSSILWKSVAQASRSNNGFMKTCVFAQTVNIRARTSPPLSENLAGNFFGIIPAKLDENENGDDLKVLVAKLRKGIEEVKEFFGKKGLDVERVKQAMLKCGEMIRNEEMVDNYNCSSWFRFPLYEVDFGWGKPIWVSMSGMTFKNFIFLLPTRDGDGIEAWLSLTDEDMDLVETDQELLDFACLEPSVV